MDELTKQLAQLSSRSIAGDAFMNAQQGTMNQLANMPSLMDHIRALFSSEKTIAALAEAVNDWKAKTPENKHLVVMLRTSDGRMMDVETARATGWQSFVAEGYIEGMPCMITGHIATLSLFCSYEETKGKRGGVGFTFKMDSATEPQPASEPKAQDKS